MAAVSSIAAKIGCTAQTLHELVKKAEPDSGVRAGVPTDVATKLKALERENRERRQGQRDPSQGFRVFCPGGARPPVQTMITFIDDHREALASSRSGMCCRSPSCETRLRKTRGGSIRYAGRGKGHY